MCFLLENSGSCPEPAPKTLSGSEQLQIDIDFLKQILYNVNTGKLYMQKDKYMRGAKVVANRQKRFNVLLIAVALAIISFVTVFYVGQLNKAYTHR